MWNVWKKKTEISTKHLKNKEIKKKNWKWIHKENKFYINGFITEMA